MIFIQNRFYLLSLITVNDLFFYKIAMEEGENTNTDLPNLNEEKNGNTSIDDAAVLSYLQSQGREVSSLDDLFKEPEKVVEVKEVNPWEGVIDEDDLAYLNYKKETGRGRKDFESLQVNLDDVSPLDFARQQVLKDAGIKLNKQQIDEYLENKLGISDLNELSTSDLIELSKYGKSVKEERIEEQNKFRQPIKKETPTEKTTNTEDEEIKNKSASENAQKERQKYLDTVKEAVNSVTETSFKVAIEENGEQKELNYGYQYSDADRSSAMSMATDLETYVQSNYGSDQEFNHKKFAEDLFWIDAKNRESVISSLVHKARAEAIEEVMKQRGNVNYSSQNKNLSSTDNPGKTISIKELFNKHR